MEGGTSPRIHESLEIPAQTPLEKRLLVTEQRRRTSKPAIGLPPPPNDALLSRLQSFLPQMEEANKALIHEDEQVTEKFELDAEEVDEEEKPVVELELACGLFDLKNEAAENAAERALVDGGVAIETYDDGTSSDSEDDTNSDESDSEERTKRKNKKQPHPGIEEIN